MDGWHSFGGPGGAVGIATAATTASDSSPLLPAPPPFQVACTPTCHCRERNIDPQSIVHSQWLVRSLCWQIKSDFLKRSEISFGWKEGRNSGVFRSVAPDVATTLLPGLIVLPVSGSSVPKDRPPQTAEHESEQFAVPTNQTAVADISNQSSCCGPGCVLSIVPSP